LRPARYLLAIDGVIFSRDQIYGYTPGVKGKFTLGTALGHPAGMVYGQFEIAHLSVSCDKKKVRGSGC
jgi:hypothetical protein